MRVDPPDAIPGGTKIDLFWILIPDLSQGPLFLVRVATFARKVAAWLQNGPEIYVILLLFWAGGAANFSYLALTFPVYA